jgi:hypothetical protein
MANYYLNTQAQSNGDHEVHKEDCDYMPLASNRILVGSFNSCEAAVSTAKQKYSLTRINGCYYCAEPCHTS